MDEYQSEGGGGQQIVQYAEAPLRRPLAVLIPLVLSVAVSLVAARVTQKRYRATTVILVESEKMPSFVRKSSTDGGRVNLQTLKQEILSRTRLEKVIRDLNPDLKDDARISGMVDKMRGTIYVGVKGNDSFTLEFDDADPKRAMDVTNRLATVFIEESAQSRAEQMAEAYEFIKSQLEEARKALEAHETAVTRFKERNMGRLPEQTTANLAALQRLQSEKQSLEASLRTAQDKLEQLEKNPASAPGPGGELGKLRNQLAEMRLRYTDEHPDVRSLRLRIEQAEQREAEGGGPAPERRGEGSLESARQQIAKLQEKSDALDEKIAGFHARVEEAPRLEQELTELNRDYAKLQGNYQTMLNKKMDAEMAEKLQEQWKGQEFKVLDPAILPKTHIYPNRQLFVLVGILAGLALGMVVALGLELIDPSFKSVHELENVVPFPVLATLPHVKPGKRPGKSAARKAVRSA